LSGRGLCDELITRPEESYRLCCVFVCDLETSRMGAPYIYDISHLRVKKYHRNNCTKMLLKVRKYSCCHVYRKIFVLVTLVNINVGPGSSVGIVTELRAGRSGDRIPVGARFSAPVQTGPGSHPASCTMCTVSFPVVKSGRGVTLTPHPLLVPVVMKE